MDSDLENPATREYDWKHLAPAPDTPGEAVWVAYLHTDVNGQTAGNAEICRAVVKRASFSNALRMELVCRTFLNLVRSHGARHLQERLFRELAWTGVQDGQTGQSEVLFDAPASGEEQMVVDADTRRVLAVNCANVLLRGLEDYLPLLGQQVRLSEGEEQPVEVELAISPLHYYALHVAADELLTHYLAVGDELDAAARDGVAKQAERLRQLLFPTASLFDGEEHPCLNLVSSEMEELLAE